MQALAKKHDNFSFGIASTIFATNLTDAENILAWARTKELDVVFNMLRFTDAMLHNKELEETIGFRQREEEFMRKFFLDRVQEESVLSGQAFMYLHYADMIANGYQADDALPVPVARGCCSTRTATCTTARTRKSSATCSTTPPTSLYYKAENLVHREHLKDEGLPDLPEPLPGERRRDEAVRAVREVPEARVPGQARSRAARRDPAGA